MLSILQIVLQVLGGIMPIYAMLKPKEKIKDNLGEAAKLLNGQQSLLGKAEMKT
jgi:hypothetical protein